MAYRVAYYSAFSRDVKSFKGDKKDIVKKAVEEIIANPSRGDALKHNWRGFQSHHFGRSPECRIVYAVYPCCSDNCDASSKCRFDIEFEDEGEDKPLPKCEGLIEFFRAGTREEFNRLYALKKKDIPSLRD